MLTRVAIACIAFAALTLVGCDYCGATFCGRGVEAKQACEEWTAAYALLPCTSRAYSFDGWCDQDQALRMYEAWGCLDGLIKFYRTCRFECVDGQPVGPVTGCIVDCW